jgi:alkanesulfonate monooxygenase SsuD/methylene tetrahydromethanopterin reductase-like flavin-dependent oxidoreductase (luciferase family)
VVTSRSQHTADNHGIIFPDKDDRYAMADEYVELVKALWNGWEADAVSLDFENGVFADHTKVHTTNFEGKYYRSKGPLNHPRMPQGEAVIVQAGQSPPGRRFGAKHADAIVGIGKNAAELKAYRDDLSDKMIEAGRKPSDCKLMYLIMPVLGETDREAQERAKEWKVYRQRDLEWSLSLSSKVSGIDYSKFDLDAPLPDVLPVKNNGVWQDQPRPPRTYNPDGTEMTLRQSIESKGGGGFRGANSVEFIGTPETVAAQMDESMQEIGGDGWLLTNLYVTRRYVAEICDGLVPALQKRGLVRDSYTHEMFRDNLLEF